MGDCVSDSSLAFSKAKLSCCVENALGEEVGDRKMRGDQL